ncbi:hypothetical protein E0H73_24200 [Kribbella pittospori]|uniref:Uncharacterized protein n=1 Tax=Kribbella pittospori TaxID=722689 RepID=A0A4R0KGU2_9ACTN|nr:hypothetical protein [Kribbella pittospori]TCC59723.1 hypothetical protein E0H73_24200 [Kribbella pittospori]
MGSFVIRTPPISIARQLWRLGEPELAERAAKLTAVEAKRIGERAGQLQESGRAAKLWPDGPRGVTPAVMLAAIEHLEGKARPCARRRRLPEKQLPPSLQSTEDERWAALTAMTEELNARPRGLRGLFRRSG